MTTTRRGPALLTALGAVGMAAVLFLGAAVAAGGTRSPARVTDRPAVGVSLDSTAGEDDLRRGITSLQARLKRLPGDWVAWSSLGYAYVQQARITGDPSYYPKAEGAFARSLAEHPTANEAALTGQSALAAGRHDFATALTLADDALEANPYSAAAHGARGDALLELGRYNAAFTAFQQMVDLKPSVASYARASYAWEVRGDLRRARSALEQALGVAYAPSDEAFVRYYLGELAWNSGDLTTADAHYRQGLRRDPTFTPLRAGRAKVAAAQGRTSAAVQAYEAVVNELPQPSYLIELGDLYAALGQADEARAQYQLVGAAKQLLTAADVNVDLELALYDADHGRPRAALRAATAEWRRRRSIFVEDAYAWALHSNGRSEQALTHARRAQRLGMRNAMFAYHKGMIEKSLGMREEARADLRRALRINPHFSTLHAPRARRALEALTGSP